MHLYTHNNKNTIDSQKLTSSNPVRTLKIHNILKVKDMAVNERVMNICTVYDLIMIYKLRLHAHGTA